MLLRQASTSSPKATGDRGCDVKGSHCLLAASGLGEACLDCGGVGLAIVGGRKEDRQPAVGDLCGQFHILGADRGQIDGQIGAARAGCS